tara:strand:- start:45241 stop:46191 length:951 start_codon:yes stop_codon:yes gene_type:complete
LKNIINWLKDRRQSLKEKGWYFLFRNKKNIMELIESEEKEKKSYQLEFKNKELKIIKDKLFEELKEEFSKTKTYGELKDFNVTSSPRFQCVLISFRFENRRSFEYTLKLTFKEEKIELRAEVREFGYCYPNYLKVEEYKKSLKENKWLQIKKKMFDFLLYNGIDLIVKMRDFLIRKTMYICNKKGVDNFEKMLGIKDIKSHYYITTPSQFSLLMFNILKVKRFKIKDIDKEENKHIKTIFNICKMSLVEETDFEKFDNIELAMFNKENKKIYLEEETENYQKIDVDKYRNLVDYMRMTDYKYNEETKELIELNYGK